MIHIITPANEGDYRDEMEQAWRLRHEIFVTEKGWSDLAGRMAARSISSIRPMPSISWRSRMAG